MRRASNRLASAGQNDEIDLRREGLSAIRRKGAGPLVLVVAPTPTMARDTLAAYGLTTDGGEMIRMVTRHTGLRGWHHGMPVLARDVSLWPSLGYAAHALENTLMTLLACGRLRLAQESDIERVKLETVQ